MSTTAGAPLDLLTGEELRAWRGMLRAHALLTKALDHQLEAEHGIPLTSYEVLMYLQDAPGHAWLEPVGECDASGAGCAGPRPDGRRWGPRPRSH